VKTIRPGAFYTTKPAQFRATIARQRDRSLVARLCRRAVGPSDYVLRILTQTIAHGGLLLAWNGAELVGMTNFERCIDGSGWLNMARTDPAWRSRGVATFLQHQAAAHAKRRGITTLRLWALSNNKASINACKKGGFRQVCEAAHVSSNLRGKKRRSWKYSGSTSQMQLDSILKSRYLSMMNGYIGHKWHFVKLTKPLLKRLENEGELYVTEDCALLITKPETRFGTPQSSLTILTGPITKALLEAKNIAGWLGARVLSSYIPYAPYQLSAAKKLGFRRNPWGKHCLVFEKRIA